MSRDATALIENWTEAIVTSGLKKGIYALIAVGAGLFLLFHFAYRGARQGLGDQNAAGSGTPPQTAVVQSPAPVAIQSPEETMLRAGFEHVVFLGLLVNGQQQYCEPVNARDAAHLIVRALVGESPPLFRTVETTVAQHDAVMILVKPTFVSQSTGLISGGICYAVDSTLVQKYQRPGEEMLIPIGRIQVSGVQLVNEYPTYGPTGPTQARSYHINYFIGDNLSDGKVVNGVSLVDRRATCVLRHDNVENRWDIQSCQRSN